MSKKRRSVNLASAPTLVGSEDFRKLHDVIILMAESAVFPNADIENVWNEVIKKYEEWESQFYGQHTSTINRKLQLFKFLRDYFPLLSSVSGVVDIVLSDLKKPGEVMRMVLPGGKAGEAKVMRREITERLGVLFSMESSDGIIFTHEFID